MNLKEIWRKININGLHVLYQQKLINEFFNNADLGSEKI